MKKLVLLLCLFFSISPLLAQDYYQEIEKKEEPKTSITVGILQGGGSLVGADLETLLYKNIGFQLGAGFEAMVPD